MAQGAVKKSKPNPGLGGSGLGSKSITGSSSKAQKMKQQPPQQHRKAVTKPKKLKSTADRVRRKFTAGLVAKTEKMLGQRAGHLELIGKGRKKTGGADKTDSKTEAKQKGGSKRFG